MTLLDLQLQFSVIYFFRVLVYLFLFFVCFAEVNYIDEHYEN